MPLLGEIVEELDAHRMPLSRVHMGMPLLHPLYSAGAYTWFPNRGVVVDNYQRGTANEQIWKEGPVHPIFESDAVEGRIRILTASDSDQYSMLVQAAADIGTAYFCS